MAKALLHQKCLSLPDSSVARWWRLRLLLNLFFQLFGCAPSDWLHCFSRELIT